MCRFCKANNVNESTGEMDNGVKTLLELKDGSQIFDLYLFRYKESNDDAWENSLVLNYGIIKPNKHVYTVKEKRIDIMYCPFCGEELV